MSIKIMTEVWSEAPVSGGDLLVLLALADWADEETRQAYPGIKKLAQKARLSERQTQYAVAKLAKLGAISIKRNASPLKTNLYHISGGFTAETQYLHPPDENADTQKLHPRDATHCVSETQPIAPKPSVTISTEPPVAVSAKRKQKKAKRLSEDWTLPKNWGDWAVEGGWSEQAVRLEAEKFKDYWVSKSGKDATKMDWFATWRNWMRNSKNVRGQENGKITGQQSKSAERVAAFIAGARGI